MQSTEIDSCGSRYYTIKIDKNGLFKLPSATFISCLSDVHVNIVIELYYKGQEYPLFNYHGGLVTGNGYAPTIYDLMNLTLLRKKFVLGLSEQSNTSIMNDLENINVEQLYSDIKILFNYNCEYFQVSLNKKFNDLINNKTIGFDVLIAVPSDRMPFQEKFSINLEKPSQNTGMQSDMIEILKYARQVSQKDISLPMIASLDNKIIVKKIQSLFNRKYYSVKLFEALKNNDLISMKKQLELGADPDYYDDQKYTTECRSIICMAVEKKNYQAIKLLLDAGADVMNGGIEAAFNSYKFLMQLQDTREKEFKESEKIIEMMFAYLSKSTRSSYETQILCDVLKIGRLDWAIKLIEAGVSVNHYSPICIASEKGYLSMVKYLVQHGATIDHTYTMCSPMYLASVTGHHDIVNFFLDQNKDQHLISIALHGFIERNDFDFVKYLMSKNPDIEFSYRGYKPLKLAIEKKNIQIAKILITAGANVVDSGALALSVKKKDKKLYQYLIEHGASAYEKDKAMVAAIDTGNIEFVTDLIKLGVPVNFHQDPIDHAIVKMQPEILKLLVEHGADINKYNICYENKANYVHLMVHRKNIEGIQMLIDNGADIKLSTTDGDTPLHYAAQNDFIEGIQLLIKNGADINAKNNYGYTPLHIAAKENNIQSVKKLVEMGADMNISNWKFDKPVHLAQGEVKEFLLQKMKK